VVNRKNKRAVVIVTLNVPLSSPFIFFPFLGEPPNGMRYLRWGRDGEAVQPEK
jgi:hypothetical protein